MSEVTEKQRNYIEFLCKRTGSEVPDFGTISKRDASTLIDELKDKQPVKRKSDYSSDALAGLAVKILAQRCEVDEIVKKGGNFQQRVAELYQVFSSARQACLA